MKTIRFFAIALVVLQGIFLQSCEITTSNLKFEPKIVVFFVFEQDRVGYISVSRNQPLFNGQAGFDDSKVDAQVSVLDEKGNELVEKQEYMGKDLWKLTYKRKIEPNEKNALRVKVGNQNIESSFEAKPSDFKVESKYNPNTKNVRVTVNDKQSNGFVYSIHSESYKDGKMLNLFYPRSFFADTLQKSSFSQNWTYNYRSESIKSPNGGGDLIIEPDSVVVKVSKCKPQLADYYRVWDEQSSATRLGVFEFYGTYPFNLKGDGIGMFSTVVVRKIKL